MAGRASTGRSKNTRRITLIGRPAWYLMPLGAEFKSPEEIRKANLRGADLRGAKIDHVDFYLVDLRDAIYDPSQVEQLRRTGAILANRNCG